MGTAEQNTNYTEETKIDYIKSLKNIQRGTSVLIAAIILIFISIDTVYFIWNTAGFMFGTNQTALGVFIVYYFNLTEFSYGFYLIFNMIGIILSLYSFAKYNRALKTFRSGDKLRFGFPLKLFKFLRVGFPVLFISLFLFYLILDDSGPTILQGSPPFYSVWFLPQLYGGLTLVFFIAKVSILAILVGLIGLVVSFWNIGSRFNNKPVAIGGFLYLGIFVGLYGYQLGLLVSLFGVIMVHIGCSEIINKIDTGSIAEEKRSKFFKFFED